MQLCMGATYSWSVYVEDLRELTGMGQGSVQLPFTLFYITFPGVMVLTGLIIKKVKPSVCAVLGGLMFGGGWILASYGDKNFLFTILGIGLLGGTGVGLAYIVPISMGVLWFPNHKGLVTGITVAGFGGGAALVSQIGGQMIENQGATPYDVFKVFGFCFMIIIVLSGLVMKPPPNEKKEEKKAFSPKEFLSSKEFWILYIAMFAGLSAGFLVNANLKEFFQGNSSQVGIMAVSLFAIFNALGRVSWGAISDKVSPSSIILVNLVLTSLVLVSGLVILGSSTGFLIFASLTGFNYGGVLVIFASSSAKIWDPSYLAMIYGFLFSANIPASFAPLLAGFSFDFSGTFDYSLILMAGFIAVVLIFVFAISKTLDSAQN